MIAAGLLLALELAAPAGPPFVRVPAGAVGGAPVGPLLVHRTEVTVADFTRFAAATGYVTAAEKAGADRTWRRPGFPVEKRQPVVYVTPTDAAAYCLWVDARLPTDLEWEFAARAGAHGRHYWGERIDGRYLWYRANSAGRPRPVGRKRPNAWGLHDVEGNVWEWAMATGTVKATADRRGGSWVDCEEIAGGPGKANSPLIGLAIHYPIPVELDHRYDDIGFRCVRPAP